MNEPIIGIDVSKATLDVVLLIDEKSYYQQFSNDPGGHEKLAAWAHQKKGNGAHVCLEATGQYGDRVAEYLYEQGFKVSVVNPNRIKAYANSKLRRNKSDKADGYLIAEYCLKENPGLWSPPPASFKDLQALIRRLEDLQENRQQESNRLQSGVTTPAVVADFKAHIAYLDQQIDKVKQAIQDLIDQHPDLKHQQDLLISIKGIGKLTAAKLLGEIRDIREFDNARQLAAYSGLTPRNVSSGTSIHPKTRLSKTGNANLRKILYMPAISAKRWNPIIHAFCDRLLKSGLTPLQAIAAAMRKLLHLAFGILKSDRPFDPDFLIKIHSTS